MTTTAHANCDHEATPKARAGCRHARKIVNDALDARLLNILSQLDIPFGSGNLLARVCCRYGCDHRSHEKPLDCAHAIVAYIDYTRVHSKYVVPESDLRNHAYYMFS